MKNVLWFPHCLPYQSCSHAGGQTAFYYASGVARAEDVKVLLAAYCWENEANKAREDFGKVGADCYFEYMTPNDNYRCLLRKIALLSQRFNPFHVNGGLTDSWSIRRNVLLLKHLKKTGYIPDVIVLEWTQMVVMIREIKRVFPKAKMIAMEEDVAFLGYERYALIKNSSLKKWLWKQKAKRLKKKEIASLNRADWVLVNNIKDKKLLLSNNMIAPMLQITPFFHDYSQCDRKMTNNSIIFYGAMGREENWKSAVWFIENVMPRLADLDVKFVVVGANPPMTLKQYAGERVEITGFVDSVMPYFANSLCFVAPLLLGAGIKIKVLEALSAGIPVLANAIAIEGIPAQKEEEYYHCETPDEYVEVIRYLINGNFDFDAMCQRERNMIYKTMDYRRDLAEVIRIL